MRPIAQSHRYDLPGPVDKQPIKKSFIKETSRHTGLQHEFRVVGDIVLLQKGLPLRAAFWSD